MKCQLYSITIPSKILKKCPMPVQYTEYAQTDSLLSSTPCKTITHLSPPPPQLKLANQEGTVRVSIYNSPSFSTQKHREWAPAHVMGSMNYNMFFHIDDFRTVTALWHLTITESIKYTQRSLGVMPR